MKDSWQPKLVVCQQQQQQQTQITFFLDNKNQLSVLRSIDVTLAANWDVIKYMEWIKVVFKSNRGWEVRGLEV